MNNIDLNKIAQNKPCIWISGPNIVEQYKKNQFHKQDPNKLKCSSVFHNQPNTLDFIEIMFMFCRWPHTLSVVILVKNVADSDDFAKTEITLKEKFREHSCSNPHPWCGCVSVHWGLPQIPMATRLPWNGHSTAVKVPSGWLGIDGLSSGIVWCEVLFFQTEQPVNTFYAEYSVMPL